MKLCVFLVVCLFSIFVHVGAKKQPFPKYFKKCKKHDPNLNECIRSAVQSSIPYLVKGMPKYGVMPIDPMEVTQMAMSQNLGPIQLNVTFHKLFTRGNANSVIKKAQANFDKRWFSFTILSPKLSMDGHYTMMSKCFGFPIEGRGDFDFHLENVTTNVEIFGQTVRRKGEEYFKITHTPVSMDIGKIVFNFRNLKNANEKLGENINWFLNRYSNRIMKELKFLTDETQGKLAAQLAQPFFDRIPFNQMYIE